MLLTVPDGDYLHSSLRFRLVALTRVSGKWINPDGFLRKQDFVLFFQFSPSLCFAEADPVGGLVTGPVKARNFDKGLCHDRTITITLLPVVGNSAGRHTQDFGCQVL